MEALMRQWWCADDAWVSYLISLNPLLFKNIAHDRSFLQKPGVKLWLWLKGTQRGPRGPKIEKNLFSLSPRVAHYFPERVNQLRGHNILKHAHIFRDLPPKICGGERREGGMHSSWQLTSQYTSINTKKSIYRASWAKRLAALKLGYCTSWPHPTKQWTE